MDPVTTTFLIVGAVGLGVLALSLLIGDLLHFGHPDLDGPFSLPAVAGFVGAFGFAGAIGARLGAGTIAAIGAACVVGLLAAVPTAWFAVKLARAASSMRTDATPTRSDLVGTVGVVVTPIPSDGYGEVRVRLLGQPVKLNARADHPIPMGRHIFVIAAPSSTSVLVEETPHVKEA
jgi:membrane-bound ClpP family serine protease